MKKILFAVVVLMLVAPASAKVFITCDQPVPDEPNLVISYECTEGEEVRCFGLDLQFDTAAQIVAVECLSDDYYVYPGQFSYDGSTPSFGTCDCTGKPGALPGPNGVTIEMCSLYADDDPDHNEAPQSSGDLVKLTVDASACITITENSLRGGGVVLADNTVLSDPNLPDPCECCVVAGCFPPGDPMYQNWVDVGKPGSWCCAYHGQGDTNGDGCINIVDMVMSFKPAYGKCYPDPAYDADADFNHDKCVNIMDMVINFKPNYGTCPQSGYDCPHD